MSGMSSKEGIMSRLTFFSVVIMHCEAVSDLLIGSERSLYKTNDQFLFLYSPVQQGCAGEV